jgi:hypothetical protein
MLQQEKQEQLVLLEPLLVVLVNVEKELNLLMYVQLPNLLLVPQKLVNLTVVQQKEQVVELLLIVLGKLINTI